MKWILNGKRIYQIILEMINKSKLENILNGIKIIERKSLNTKKKMK